MSVKSDQTAAMLQDTYQPGDVVVEMHFNLKCVVIARWEADTESGRRCEAYIVHLHGYPALRMVYTVRTLRRAE